MLRNFATFSSDIEVEPEWDEEGNPVTPGGRKIVEVIRSGVAEHGWACSETEQRSFYGWMFEVESDLGTQMVFVQYPDPWLLTVERKPGFWRSLVGKVDRRIDPQLVADISDVLAENSPFRDIKWYFREEYSSEDSDGELQNSEP